MADVKLDRPKTTVQYEQQTNPSSQSSSVASWIKSRLRIGYKPPASLLTEPPPTPPPPLTDQESVQVLDDFFTDDSGACIDLSFSQGQDDRAIQPIYDTLPLIRTATTQSAMSMWSLTESDFLGAKLQLDDLVELIRLHRSLQRAEIHSTEGYREWRNAILHRFLVVELRRGGKSSVWLRIDRRMQKDTGKVRFVLNGGQSPANDTAIFSTDKAALVKGAQRETWQRFKDHDDFRTLGEFRHLLQVVREELVRYQLWPANCWFLVSLLQQHLQGNETGSFVDESPKWGGTAPQIRFGVKERLRLIHRIPLSFSTQDVLVSLKAGPNPAIHALVSKALGHVKWITSDDMRQVAASSDSGFQAADSLHQIADFLLASGRSEHEMCLRQQAVGIAGELCRRDPRRYQRQLASYLRSLGDVLHKLGHSRVALRFLNEAVSLWRSLYRGYRNRLILIIAWQRTRNAMKTSVRKSGSYLSHAFHTGALVAQVQNQPLQASLQVSSNFASSLFTLAIVLHDTKRFNDACSADAEEVLIHRKLYILDPEGHRAALSVSLHSSSASLTAAGRAHAALGCAHEAVTLRRELFEANPDLHRADLSDSLDNLGNSLSSVRRFSEAWAANEEAVTLRRELFEADPDPHCAELSRYLNNLGNSLNSLGRFKEAWTARKEAVTMRRKLFEANPKPHRALLSSCLTNLGHSLHSLGRFGEACTANEEAIALQRELFEANPDPHRADLSGYLDNLGNSLDSLGRFGEAWTAKEEAVTLRRELFEADPDPHCADLSRCLNNLGNSLDLLGRSGEAWPAKEEAVTLRRKLFKADPDRHCADLSNHLANLGISLHSLGRFGEAWTAKEEAVTLRRELFKADPDQHRADLSIFLDNLGYSLDSLGRFAEARAVRNEALTL